MLRPILLSVFVTALSAFGWAHNGDDDHPSNDVDILEPPAPEYPELAAQLGVLGRCEVMFDLFDYGNTIQVTDAKCTSTLFCVSAERAIKGMKLKVVNVEGAPDPGERQNVVYPLKYTFPDVPEPIQTYADGLPLLTCARDIIS